MSNKILISGGTGLVGKRLTELLIDRGYEVAHLSRSKKEGSNPKTFQWNIKKGYIEKGALDGVSNIIHLAGAGVADEKWSEERKKEIMDSRTQSTRLLFNEVISKGQVLNAFISASAIGYYGNDTGDRALDESAELGEGFLAKVVNAWEDEIDAFERHGIRTVKMRTGIVLDSDDGALPKMTAPVKYFVGAPLGSGEQYMSWIHIDDLCEMYIAAIEDKSYQGVYNSVAPFPVTNKVFTEKIAKELNRFLFLPNVPAFVLKLIFGEMSTILLDGNNVISSRLQKHNFNFKYKTLEEALTNLL